MQTFYFFEPSNLTFDFSNQFKFPLAIENLAILK